MQIPKRTATFLGTGVALLAAGVALGAVHLSFHDAALGRRARKGVGLLLSVAGVSALVGYTQALPSGARVSRSDDYHGALLRAKAEHKPLTDRRSRPRPLREHYSRTRRLLSIRKRF